jgi:hypothetical protein
MAAGSRISGMLLCQTGSARLAFAAQEVASIESSREIPRAVGAARQAFGEAAGSERVLLADSGEAVSVDTVELDAEPVPLLPVPALMGRIAGGSLRGFVQVRGKLWPLVALVEFGRFLAPSSEEAA